MQKSNILLKVTGILMIAGGAIGLVLRVPSLLCVVAATLISSGNSGLIVFSVILFLLGSVAQLIAGILGVANAGKPEKAQVCITFGILVVLLTIASNILNGAGVTGINILWLVIGLVVPIFYLVGAFQMKNKASD